MKLSQLANRATYQKLKNQIMQFGGRGSNAFFSSAQLNKLSRPHAPIPYTVLPTPPTPPTRPARNQFLGPTPTSHGFGSAQSGIFMPMAFTGLGQSGFVNLTNIPELEPIDLDIPETSLFNHKIPQAMLSKYTVGGKNAMLKQSDYKASGGEGVVYVKNGTAYKIYHDPKKMIPPGKIHELAALASDNNILGPQEVVYLDNIPAGFTMKFKQDTEFLCKLFTKGFRDRMGITPDNINGLVKNMQDTLRRVHSKNILVVDYNEMNFLVNNAWDNVYHIDVDSYQTPSYPATAIMESIRDRKVKNRQFSTLSDWFSFACVAFQLYIGTHPYKGRHPDFAPKDWLEMMNQGISVFNRKSKLPPATQSFDVIPKGHLKWFEAVFEKGERSAPPEPDQVQVIAGPVKAQIVSGNDKFNVDLIQKYASLIEVVRYIDGIRYAITQTGVYADAKEFISFAPEVGFVAKRTTKDLCGVQGDLPVIVEHNRIEGKLRYKTLKGLDVGVIDSNGYFVANRAVYTVVRDSLIEVTFRNAGAKTTAMQQPVANIFHNHQVFDGLVIQNMLETCRFSIPYESGKCATIRIPELDKARIVDARYDCGIAIVIAEQASKYNRHTFVFNKECTSYTSRIESDVTLEDINFAVKDNGVCISANGDNLEIFADNNKVKLVPSPLNNNEPLVIYKNDTMIVNRDGIYKISSK